MKANEITNRFLAFEMIADLVLIIKTNGMKTTIPVCFVQAWFLRIRKVQKETA